jgi:hypothetical protein
LQILQKSRTGKNWHRQQDKCCIPSAGRHRAHTSRAPPQLQPLAAPGRTRATARGTATCNRTLAVGRHNTPGALRRASLYSSRARHVLAVTLTRRPAPRFDKPDTHTRAARSQCVRNPARGETTYARGGGGGQSGDDDDDDDDDGFRRAGGCRPGLGGGGAAGAGGRRGRRLLRLLLQELHRQRQVHGGLLQLRLRQDVRARAAAPAAPARRRRRGNPPSVPDRLRQEELQRAT